MGQRVRVRDGRECLIWGEKAEKWVFIRIAGGVSGRYNGRRFVSEGNGCYFLFPIFDFIVFLPQRLQGGTEVVL